MTVRCTYCFTEQEYDDPAELDAAGWMLCWHSGTAHPFCGVDCWFSQALFDMDDAA